MAAIVELPVVIKPKATVDAANAPTMWRELEVRFPDRCVYCGAPAGETSRATVAFRPSRDEAELTAILQIPYCSGHQAANQRITRFNRRAAGIAVLAALAAAIYVAGLVKAVYLLKPLIGLAAALPLSTVFLFLWSILRSLLGQFFPEIRHTGIWRATLGFRVDYSQENHRLRFKFLDADYATRFVELNKSGGG